MRSTLFSKIKDEYAVPKKKFWEKWNSHRHLFARFNLIPKPIGHEFGEKSKWVVVVGNVYMPSHDKSKSIKEILQDIPL